MKKLILLVSLLSFSMHSQNVTVNSGSSFTIQSTSSLTVGGNFSTNGSGTVILNSDATNYSSIIISGSVSSGSNITYNRYVNSVGTDEWDLIGSPVNEQSINSFATTNAAPLATGGGSGSDQYAIGIYDNETDNWTNYTTSTIGTAGDFDIGKGYQMATDIGATLAFTGTPVSTAQTQAIQDYSSTSGRIWNLIANPYPSYIYANNNANPTHNFLKANYEVDVTDNLHNSYIALYGYDADGSGYTVYNQTSAATYIAPGQAFMVASDNSSSGTSISFTPEMRTVQGGDDFISGRIMNPTSSEFLLKLYEDEILIDNTRFYFDNDLTLGLDPGYDAGHFNQDASLMSRLVEEDEGVGFVINAMGSDALGGVSIPLEVNQPSNVPFRISLEDSSIAPDVEVQLEDRLLGTLTLLNDEDFTLTAEDDLIGIGRFYLHLGNVTLGEDSFANSLASIYKGINDDYITIEGLVNIQKARIKLYNLIGQEIIHKVLSNNQTNYRISTQGIPQGVYVIKLQFENSKITKKLIIN